MPGAEAVETAAAAGAGVGAGADAAAVEPTEDEILSDVTTATEDGAAVDGTDGQGAGTGTADPDGTQQDPADALNPDEVAAAIPAELRDLLSDPKRAPHLQRAFNQLADYSKLGTVRDARTFAEQFPGGVQEAVEYKTRALDLADWDGQYESADPKQQGDLVHTWYQHAVEMGRPEAFRGIVRVGLDELKRNDPEGFKELTGGTIEQSLGGDLVATDGQRWNLAAQVEAINEAIRTKDSESLAGLSYFLVRELGALGLGKRQEGGRQTKEAEQFKQRETSVAEREKAIEVERQNLFNTAANADIEGHLGRSIDQRLADVLKGTAFNDKGKAKIKTDIVRELNNRLASDRAYNQRVNQMAKEARYNPAQRQKLVEFVVNRAKALIATVARDVIGERTAEFVQQTKDTNARRENGARARVDITGGQSGRAGAGMGHMTREQIQNMPDAEKDKYL